MGYSPERKSAVLKRMLPPNNLAIRQLSQDKGFPRPHCTSGVLRRAARGSLQPLLNLLEKPVNGEEENLIKLLFQRLDTVIAGQDALQIQVSNLDQLVRDVMGEDD